MDKSTINKTLSEIYIPSDKKTPKLSVPEHHPSLVMNDRGGDINHRNACGCGEGSPCLAKQQWWEKEQERKRQLQSVSRQKSSTSLADLSNQEEYSKKGNATINLDEVPIFPTYSDADLDTSKGNTTVNKD